METATEAPETPDVQDGSVYDPETGLPPGMSPDPEPQEPEAAEFDVEDDGQLTIDGTSVLSMSVGGKSATSSSVRITGGKATIPGGEYKKGERITLHVEAVVRGVNFVDEVDGKTGQVVACERQHRAQITGLHVA